MIFNVDPVSNVGAVTVDRYRLTAKRTLNQMWNELLWKLIRTEVVRAVGCNGRKPIGVMLCRNDVICCGL